MRGWNTGRPTRRQGQQSHHNLEERDRYTEEILAAEGTRWAGIGWAGIGWAPRDGRDSKVKDLEAVWTEAMTDPVGALEITKADGRECRRLETG